RPLHLQRGRSDRRLLIPRAPRSDLHASYLARHRAGAWSGPEQRLLQPVYRARLWQRWQWQLRPHEANEGIGLSKVQGKEPPLEKRPVIWRVEQTSGPSDKIGR